MKNMQHFVTYAGTVNWINQYNTQIVFFGPGFIFLIVTPSPTHSPSELCYRCSTIPYDHTMSIKSMHMWPPFCELRLEKKLFISLYWRLQLTHTLLTPWSSTWNVYKTKKNTDMSHTSYAYGQQENIYTYSYIFILLYSHWDMFTLKRC